MQLGLLMSKELNVSSAAMSYSFMIAHTVMALITEISINSVSILMTEDLSAYVHHAEHMET
jgi:hypothetical protein